MMKKKTFFSRVAAASLFCCGLWNTACVNQVEEEVQESDIPITFSTKIEKVSTKVINTVFNKGDVIGLFGVLSSANIEDEPYINNLRLICGDKSLLIPERAVFYPEGDAPLDFISYYPYQPELQFKESPIIPISVESEQNDPLKHSNSYFLIARKSTVESSKEPVELEFHHKLTKIKIILVPEANESVEDLLKANPKIVATGLRTEANYNLKDNTFSDLSNIRDIVSFGEWKIEDGKLVGKEIIIIPQELTPDEHSFTLDWNGRIYNCPFPEMNKEEESECEIYISALQTNSNVLKGIAGSISEWKIGSSGTTDNQKKYSTVHLSSFAFSQSNIYRIYYNGKPITEICKEYLNSKSLSSRAIVAYPVLENEQTDLSQGIVLQLLDCDQPICGGTIRWDLDSNSFVYQEGSSKGITHFYLNNRKEILLAPTDEIVNINISGYTLRDFRNGELTEYPLVKIGTQYWMQTELHTTSYQNGKEIAKQTTLGRGAGYFKPDKYDIYFYNGEALLEGTLNPYGWRIPSLKDWEQLKSYTNGEASLIKKGNWKALTTDGIVCPNNDLTQFGAYPIGIWNNGSHYNAFKLTAFWSWDKENNEIPTQTVFFSGDDNGFIMQPTKSTNQDYYKALSIRCIKE